MPDKRQNCNGLIKLVVILQLTYKITCSNVRQLKRNDLSYQDAFFALLGYHSLLPRIRHSPEFLPGSHSLAAGGSVRITVIVIAKVYEESEIKAEGDLSAQNW